MPIVTAIRLRRYEAAFAVSKYKSKMDFEKFARLIRPQCGTNL